jgi:hypothetical protein
LEKEKVKNRLRDNQKKCMEKMDSKKQKVYNKNSRKRAKIRKIFICPISGDEILDKEEYKKREWSIYPSGRIRLVNYQPLKWLAS